MELADTGNKIGFVMPKLTAKNQKDEVFLCSPQGKILESLPSLNNEKQTLMILLCCR